MAKPIPLKCSCGTTVATLENGCLVIEARHHGEKHRATFALDSLAKWAQQGFTRDDVSIIDNLQFYDLSVMPKR